MYSSQDPYASAPLYEEVNRVSHVIHVHNRNVYPKTERKVGQIIDYSAQNQPKANNGRNGVPGKIGNSGINGRSGTREGEHGEV
jgi:hypothetical protein